MKNQYYGDVNDYVKYSILRHLATGSALTLGINWYLTPDDGSSDGNLLGYLQHPAKWRYLDPDLFDRLHHSLVSQGHRNVRRATVDLGLTPEPLTYPEITPDNTEERTQWLKESLRALEDAELLFLDPDNGLSVKSVPMGKRKSSKYVYDEEIALYADGGRRSLIIYQHNRRQSRHSLIVEGTERLKRVLGSDTAVMAIAAPHVVYYVAAAPGHKEALTGATMQLSAKWPKLKVTVSE